MIACLDYKDVLSQMSDSETAWSFEKHWIEKTEKASLCTFAI